VSDTGRILFIGRLNAMGTGRESDEFMLKVR
jgi:hypothetical protein